MQEKGTQPGCSTLSTFIILCIQSIVDAHGVLYNRVLSLFRIIHWSIWHAPLCPTTVAYPTSLPLFSSTAPLTLIPPPTRKGFSWMLVLVYDSCHEAFLAQFCAWGPRLRSPSSPFTPEQSQKGQERYRPIRDGTPTSNSRNRHNVRHNLIEPLAARRW